MKKTAIFTTILFSMALLLVACSGDAEKNITDDEIKGNLATEDQDHSDENNDLNEEKNGLENTAKLEEPKHVENNNSNLNNNAPSNSSESEDYDALSQYSVEEIEYARVWLQLGVNQDIDELNVEHISKGTPLNLDDETSIDYPEDVIQLSGTRLVDGIITYSGNGDGTINVYNVPKRWDGKNPAGEDVYKKIIEDIEQESIETNDDKKVEELIKILKINS